MTRASAWLPLLLILAFAAPAHAQRQTTASAESVQRWVDLVNAHVPGRPDAAVARIRVMPYSARQDLSLGFGFFIRVLRGKENIQARNDFDKKMIELAGAVRRNPGAGQFLRRAAVLHGDAAILAGKLPVAPDDAPPSIPARDAFGTTRARVPVSEPPPILTNERVVLTRDGEVVGDTPLNWNLPFARSLLEDLLQIEDQVATGNFDFVGEWSHAIAAYLFSEGMNGDAVRHLRDAERMLPEDPRLLFDRGTFAETFGLPVYQAVRLEAPSHPGVSSSTFPTEEKTNAEAERMFRRTLEVDPGYVDARVRLARLLDRRGRHDEAAAEIGKALEAQPAGVAGYYAHLIAGRIASARGRYDEALQQYRAASAIFGHAQSALLGASHAALMLADVPETLAPLAELRPADQADSDPWWDYQLGAGLEIEELLAKLWARASKR